MDYDDLYFDKTGNSYRGRQALKGRQIEDDVILDNLRFRSSRREARKRSERMNARLLR